MRIFMKWHTGIAFQNTVSYHFVHPGCAFSMPQQPASHMWDIHKIISFLTNLSTKSPDKKSKITGIGKSCNSNLYGIRKTYEMDCISKITKLIFKKQLFKKSKDVFKIMAHTWLYLHYLSISKSRQLHIDSLRFKQKTRHEDWNY